MRADSLEDFKSAIRELKKYRPEDEDQNEILDQTLSAILESYGFEICRECDQIVGVCWMYEHTCNRCRVKEMKATDSDLFDWETRHR